MASQQFNNQTAPAGKKEKPKSPPIDLEKYQDPEGLTLKKLNFGLWYVKHLFLFRKIGRWLLIIISVITWSLFLYTFGHYVLFGMRQDNDLLLKLSDDTNIKAIHQIILKNRPLELQVAPVSIFHNELSNTYDFAALIKNQNPRYYAHFIFFLYDNGQPIASSSSFILPQEEKYLMILGKKLNKKPQSIKLVFVNINWQRVNNKIIPNWQEFVQLHTNFDIIEPKFTPPRQSSISEKLPIGEVSFSIANKTPFNYQSVGLNILLWRTNHLIGVGHHVLNNVYSGHSYQVIISWPANVSQVDKVEVVPEVDITRNDIYLNFEPSQSGDYR